MKVRVKPQTSTEMTHVVQPVWRKPPSRTSESPSSWNSFGARVNVIIGTYDAVHGRRPRRGTVDLDTIVVLVAMGTSHDIGSMESTFRKDGPDCSASVDTRKSSVSRLERSTSEAAARLER
jgi:hypothetical protein